MEDHWTLHPLPGPACGPPEHDWTQKDWKTDKNREIIYHVFPTMKTKICSSVQYLNEIKNSFEALLRICITNVLKWLRQRISSCEWQLKNESIPQISFCIATTAGYLVTSMATVIALETDPSSSVNGGSGEALKSSLMG